MGRKRIELGPDANAQIVAGMVRGTSADELALQFKVSPATMKRRMRELRGKVPEAREKVVAQKIAAPPVTPRAQPSAPAVDDASDVEAFGDATLKQIDEWLAVAKRKAEEAAATQNAEEHATYMRMVISLLEARRKATPPPKIDPNESPDMIELAKQAREKLHNLADALVRTSKSPIADTIAGIIRPKQAEDEPAD